MRKRKITKRQIRKFLKDEREGYKEYKKLGLNKLARDEKKHYNFLKRLNKKI